MDVIHFSLMMYVEAPSPSGMSIYNSLSPIATLICYEGLSSDPDALLWTHISPGCGLYLRQGQNSVVEMFAQIAQWMENSVSVFSQDIFYTENVFLYLQNPSLSESTLEWAKCAITVRLFKLCMCVTNATWCLTDRLCC